jgi:hypothetical protein
MRSHAAAATPPRRSHTTTMPTSTGQGYSHWIHRMTNGFVAVAPFSFSVSFKRLNFDEKNLRRTLVSTYFEC